MLRSMASTTDSARAFVQAFSSKAAPLSKQAAHAQWTLSTAASPEAEKEAMTAQIAIAKLYADEAVFLKSKELDGEAIDDPLVARQVRLLHQTTVAYRRDPATLERIAAIETELEGTYSSFRGELSGEKLSENRIREILKTERDVDRRRGAWEAAKTIGSVVAPRLLELAKLRNTVAKKNGYRDWFAMSLAIDELEEDWLFAMFAELEEATKAPFAAEKAAIDAEASAWLGVPIGELMPWHYQDVFFQEAPTTTSSSIDPMLADKDVVALARTFYADLGFGSEVETILAKSDLFAREKKTQGAFCTHLDRSGDVRIVCNVMPSERWLDTTLHELGHGIYDSGIDPTLPWTLRTPAHTFATEAIAMLMGRRTRDPEFLRRYVAGRSDDEVAIDKRLLRRRMLLLLRWVMVMTSFERELYKEPLLEPAELGRIWWDLVARFQGVQKPPGDRPTDWATKLHIALAPVYYQNYLLGELTASQLEAAIRASTGKTLTANPGAAALLRSYFAPGSSLRWDVLIEKVTGEPLSPRHFVRDFIA
jgi:peptidyl-dipeptidase A